jgi:hypothetical protein
MFHKILSNLKVGPMREKLRRELVGCLIKEFGGEDTTASVDDNAHNEFVDVVLTEIDNYTKKLNGNTTQLRFHPLIMRVATNLYMSSPSAYMDLQKSTIFALPSESTMKKKKSEGSVKDGKNVTIYMLHSFAHKEKATKWDRTYIGHLECDEFKLKAGLWWKTKSHELVGFADDVSSFDDIVNSFLKDADGPSNDLATYVNQWIYRLSCGMTFPCEYFYNATSLNGHTIFNQWYPIVSSCEAIGCMVIGTSCDAGGGNAFFFSAF